MDAISLIRRFEGFKETPYWDVNALRTGYGSDTVTLADGTVRPVGKDTRVTREDADRDLARRVQSEFMPRAAAAVGEDVFAQLPQNQQAALTSITYNYGTLPENVAAAVKSGDPQAVAAQIRRLGSHNNGVNKDRRNLEAGVFLGVPDSGGGADQGQAAAAYNTAPAAPVEKNPLRLAWAYRNGKMTPEDAKLYEDGLAKGIFSQPTQPQAPDPLQVYQQVAMRQRRPMQQTQIQPLQMPQGWGGLGS